MTPWRRLSHENPVPEYRRCLAMAARSLFQRLLLVVLVLGTCTPAAFPAAAQLGSAPATSQAVDLAWVALTPSDLPEPGYGQAFSTLFTAADYADAAARGQDEAIILQLTQDLQVAGWQRAHLSTLQLPSAADPDLHD